MNNMSRSSSSNSVSSQVMRTELDSQSTRLPTTIGSPVSSHSHHSDEQDNQAVNQFKLNLPGVNSRNNPFVNIPDEIPSQNKVECTQSPRLGPVEAMSAWLDSEESADEETLNEVASKVAAKRKIW